MRRAPAALVVAIMASCSSAGPTVQPADPASASSPRDAARHAEALMREANRARTGAGLEALKSQPALDRIATVHAQELAERRVLDHNSMHPERHTLSDRMRNIEGLRGAAENIAAIPVQYGTVGQPTVRTWLDSPHHRENLLGLYTHTGIGVALGGDGYWYIVQVYVSYF